MANSDTTAPLISLRDIRREFAAGDQRITVLDDIDLDIWPGEMVAIMGASGSGKSTLMNLIGCLDRPTAGQYLYAGQDVAQMPEEDRARLRRAHFGFIFQRYQLLPDLDAVSNVEVPAIYAGAGRVERRIRATALLDRLGLGDRKDHRPGALSGGQQQRVSVARALMNGGEVILADEPTGALDSKSGAELLALLDDLHARGHTIVIITHDAAVAARAQRVVELRDGRITSDSRVGPPDSPAIATPDPVPAEKSGLAALGGRMTEAFVMAVRALNAHRMRSFLTMLGIIIGIASVVSVVALGTGSQEKVLENIASLGTSTITIRPGTGFGDRRSGAIDTLIAADADALATQPYAASVSPEVNTTANVTRAAVSASASVRGVGTDYFDVGAYTVTEGQLFTQASLQARDQVAVLDTDAASTFFPDGENPIGKTVQVGRVPLRVIGVVKASGASFGPQSIRVFTPYPTAMLRITGGNTVDAITVRVGDDYDIDAAEAQIDALMLSRHGGTRDFFLTNSDTIRDSITSTAETLTWLVSAIAVISLLVGGIGVMNIMLVSVTERTKEIGVRVAVGARRSDIVAQFLTEAILVCLLGGVIGVSLALGSGWLIESLQDTVRLTYSAGTVVLAFASSTLIGITFGYLPARSAARLDPVVALTRE
ncbi:MacB family efflux pump subunit [Frigidibacter mobilis]|uniref:Pyoverdine export ATP-binding/permease protein PvdT n=1 Tax=Frigidibacter mobilis TaxID=1335048 RepID=A0A159ZAF8_9RHOB|nr:MacB family efflux pump subunit [Frigidibacter mobilis]AMY71938.1 macrolide export ABC transporter ATP-binding/permease MacB [Frigidibacter mobilis]